MLNPIQKFLIAIIFTSISMQAEPLKWEKGKTENGIPFIKTNVTTNINGIKTPVILYFHCDPKDDGLVHGTLALELTIQKANTFKDFKYEDYEGPDSEKLMKMQVRLISKSKTVFDSNFDSNVQEFDPTTSSVLFSTFQVTKDKGKIKNLFKLIPENPETIQIVLTDSKNKKKKLELNISLQGIDKDFKAMIKPMQ